MRIERNEIFTGLFVLVGTILALSTILFIAGYNLLDDRAEYWVRMDKLAGVKKGTQIKTKNYTIGEVKEVIPIYGTDVHFKARVVIDKDFPLFRGTRINITNQNVIGDTVLEFYPSFAKKYRLVAGDTLFANNIVNLDEMITEISGMVGNLSKMISSLTGIAGDNKGNIRDLFTNLNRSVTKVNLLLDSSQGEIVEIMKNIKSTSATLDKFSKDFSADPWKLLDRNAKTGGNKPSSSSALP